MNTKLNAAVRLTATTPKQDAVEVVVDLFKKGGLRVFRVTSPKKMSDLTVKGSKDPKDVLFEAGFRLTKTGYHDGTVIRRKNILVVLTKDTDNGMTAVQIALLAPEDVARKDKEDANWGASYKGMRFAD